MKPIEDSELCEFDEAVAFVLEPSRNNIISALINLRYPTSAEIALINTYNENPDKYADAYAEYQEFRQYVKDAVREHFGGEVTLEDVKDKKIAEITKYDKSSAVNSFSLYGDEMWLDKATRVGLVNAVNSAKVLGQETVTLGLGGHTYTLPCDTALAMLASLEMYALACYNVTLGHKNAVKGLESIEAVEAYDYKVGYPDKLIFE